MTTELSSELEKLGYAYPVLAKKLKEFLGDGEAISSKNCAPALEDRKQVFEFWADKFHKKRAVFKSGSKRDAKIVARIKSVGKEEVLKAVQGFSLDPWRHEELVRHELATLLRTDEQIEVGLDILDNGGRHAIARSNDKRNANGGANSTVGYGRENRHGLPQHDNSGRTPVRHDSTEWSEMRRDEQMGKEDDPF
tara:strand:- start:453 stop:1034 length:582 start_codon:yes stop_codon:yes gene_type:complete